MWPDLLMGLVTEGIDCTVFISLVSVDPVTGYRVAYCAFWNARCFHACLIHTSLTILITNPCGE